MIKVNSEYFKFNHLIFHNIQVIFCFTETYHVVLHKII